MKAILTLNKEIKMQCTNLKEIVDVNLCIPLIIKKIETTY